MKRVLMIAFHFPPYAGGGVQRTLRFVQQLPEFGWEPIVLTANLCAYPETSQDLVPQIPQGIVVERAFALDVARLIPGVRAYPRALARPDRWWIWRFRAVAAGLRRIREMRPSAIWSTYPIPTAHVIAGLLCRRTEIPWIADFRDPMAQNDYPLDRELWRCYRAIEQATLRVAARSVFTAPGAAAEYASRYPESRNRIALIENGYDEEAFVRAAMRSNPPRQADAPIVLLHSGTIYTSERDPTALFEALGRLRKAGRLAKDSVELRFRASANDRLLQALAGANGVADVLRLAPPVGYEAALHEMTSADALLLMQASNCNAQIPGKAYEYLRAGPPIFALTDPDGDTGRLMRRAGVVDIVPLDAADIIAEHLSRFLVRLADGTATRPSRQIAAVCDRTARARELAALLDESSA
jgi:glycosyltransferase involved in cell wall biosynthesis